ncbi:hypothetical protein [Paracoccus sp. 22332]|uniref:hypothetical protein n=1 Tax=Paracoccus sp. 22332 TaxID=3453913 RepID=UPI003F82BB9B
MSDVATYQQAFREYQSRKTELQRFISELNKMSSGAQYHIRDFLGWNFHINLEPRGRQFGNQKDVHVSHWPTREEFDHAAKAWISSHGHLMEVWRSLPDTNKDGLQTPPADLTADLRSYR